MTMNSDGQMKLIVKHGSFHGSALSVTFLYLKNAA